MRRIVLIFGFLAGAVLSGMMLLTLPFQDQIGFDKGVIVGYTSMVLAFLMVYFGVRSYRDNVAGGQVTFGRAFQVGLLITLIASACYVATWQFIYYKVTPDFVDKYSAYVVEKARSAGAPETEIAVRRAEMEVYRRRMANPLINIAYTLIEPLPIGLLFTFVTAVLLSRSRRAAEPGLSPSRG